MPARRSRGRILASALGAGLLLGACTGGTLGPGPSEGAESIPIETLGPPDLGPSPGDSGTITIDSSLLAILPREVDSIPVTESPDGDSDALANDVLPTIATAAVSAIAVDAQAKDLAYALVVKVRPDAFTEDIFRDWRDSFDEGVCGGSDQVVGNAQQTVAGNTVYIGTCANGLRTYHVWLKPKDLLISISSAGDRRLGLVMLGNLRG